jgi:hypothetical protein
MSEASYSGQGRPCEGLPPTVLCQLNIQNISGRRSYVRSGQRRRSPFRRGQRKIKESFFPNAKASEIRTHRERGRYRHLQCRKQKLPNEPVSSYALTNKAVGYEMKNAVFESGNSMHRWRSLPPAFEKRIMINFPSHRMERQPPPARMLQSLFRKATASARFFKTWRILFKLTVGSGTQQHARRRGVSSTVH